MKNGQISDKFDPLLILDKMIMLAHEVVNRDKGFLTYKRLLDYNNFK
jgi:hypothetical protein